MYLSPIQILFQNKHSFKKYAKMYFLLTRAGLKGDHVIKGSLIENSLEKEKDNEQAHSARGPL